MTDRDVERDLKAQTKERDRRMLRSIAREWEQAGYSPRQHLIGVNADGHTQTLLVQWRDTEAHGARFRPESDRFGCWLAGVDIWELESAIRRSAA